MRIGIDLGGTKIEGIVIDDAGRERARRRVPTPKGDYRATVEAIARLVARARVGGSGGRATVGVGIPGRDLARQRTREERQLDLPDRPAAAGATSETALERPVRLANDANCFALSEAIDGAGRGARVVFGVILGTGVGGGIVVDGRVLEGANAIAGEWGHNPLPLPAATTCRCGPATAVAPAASRPTCAGRRSSVKAVRSWRSAIARYEARLARALAGVVNLLDPDVIVLGGGVSNVDRLYANVPRLWRAHVFSDHVATRLAKHAHGDSSGVRGAAWLWGGPPGP